MTRRSLISIAAIAAALALVPGLSIQQAAAQGLCSAGTQTGGISVNDVTYPTGTPANDCYGIVDGAAPNVDTADDINAISATWGTEFQFIAKAQDGSNPDSGDLDGATFTLSTEDLGETSGTFLIEWENLAVDTTFDVVIAIKAANPWAAWLFADVLFTAGDGSTTGTFEINWTTNGPSPQTPGLSHISLYLQLAGEVPPGEVPEPATLTVLGTMLVGLAVAARSWRRRSR